MGGEPSALAAKAATATTPIVFVVGGDPLRSGIVTGLHRPGANMTGVSLFISELGAVGTIARAGAGGCSYCRTHKSGQSGECRAYDERRGSGCSRDELANSIPQREHP